MSSTWPMVPLAEVLQLQRRWIKLNPTETYQEIGIRSFGNGIFHKARIQGSTLGSKRVLRIEPGDLVFNNVFAWEGAVAVAGPAEAGMIGSHRFVIYTVNPAKATAEFLQLYFKTKHGREVLLKASPGSAGRNKTLGLDRFMTHSVPVPPLTEQRRLVERIDALAIKIEEAQQIRFEVETATANIFAAAAKFYWQNTAAWLVARTAASISMPGRCTWVSSTRPARSFTIRTSPPLAGRMDASDHSGGDDMNPTMAPVVNAALARPDEDRVQPVEVLLASLQPPDKPPFGESWRDLIRRRSAELRSARSCQYRGSR